MTAASERPRKKLPRGAEGPLLVIAAGVLMLATYARAQEAAPRSRRCTPAAVESAARERGMRCPRCNHYEVVPARGENYVCCHCGRAAGFAGFVHMHRR